MTTTKTDPNLNAATIKAGALAAAAEYETPYLMDIDTGKRLRAATPEEIERHYDAMLAQLDPWAIFEAEGRRVTIVAYVGDTIV